MDNPESTSHKSLSQIFSQSLGAMVFGILFFLFILLFSTTVFQILHYNHIFPGVHVGGMDIGGMSIESAAVHLAQNYQLNDTGTIHLLYGEEMITERASDIGLQINAAATALEAYQFGRTLPIKDWIWQQAVIFSPHIEIAPTIIFDEQKAADVLSEISRERDQPLKEAQLKIEGTQVTALPGHNGRVLDIDASLENIKNSLNNFALDDIPLLVTYEEPVLIDATSFIPLAQQILEQPFIIETPDLEGVIRKTWTLTPENLAPMLIFVPDGKNRSSIQPRLNEAYLLDLLYSIAEQTDTNSENPRFIFNDDTRELDLLAPGKKGYSVLFNESAAEIQSSLARGKHKARLSIEFQSPAVSDDASSEELGITELIHQESSYFYGSDTSRVHNIETAADQFHGLLIPPGDTFSMADSMGDISLDNGYAEALIIYNGKTIEGVGGGVCQVSTTLFRTAFFAGFPIIERHPHAYRVSYYEKISGNKRSSNLAGLDATVYIPLVDLKFTNDTPYWLLMETYPNRSASRLTWKFYSTYDGREMEWLTTGPTNIVKPKKPLYQLNKSLASGEIKQIDWEAEGADVTVTRKVYKNSTLLFEDSFFTRYEPWRAIYEYGPGTEGIPSNSKD